MISRIIQWSWNWGAISDTRLAKLIGNQGSTPYSLSVISSYIFIA